MLKKTLLEFVVTFGFIGKIKFAPGTFGSLAAFPFMYLLIEIISQYRILDFINNSFNSHEIVTMFYFFILVLLIMFVIGVISSSLYMKYYANEHDPKEIVIDEVVGQMLTNVLTFFGVVIISDTILVKKLGNNLTDFIFVFLLPFCLFRVFDIKKPWPIDYIDSNVKGGLGVMLDDILASVFASVVFYTIIFGILNFL